MLTTVIDDELPEIIDASIFPKNLDPNSIKEFWIDKDGVWHPIIITPDDLIEG
ncbi:hypothetical protein [Leptospira sarikeiensis]|uniref:hypothetical protein n=1 Tax=Leptospira sarikeiensis TaxID=2484943 RepID=UPI0014385D0E|nr:hypothetical protein [Leptospira sarikeiensis]